MIIIKLKIVILSYLLFSRFIFGFNGNGRWSFWGFNGGTEESIESPTEELPSLPIDDNGSLGIIYIVYEFSK